MLPQIVQCEDAFATKKNEKKEKNNREKERNLSIKYIKQLQEVFFFFKENEEFNFNIIFLIYC